MSEVVDDAIKTTSIEASLGLTDAEVQLLQPKRPLTQEEFDYLEQDYHILQWNWEHTNYPSSIFPEEDDDAEDWKSLEVEADERTTYVKQARYLTRKNPHVKRTQNLYEYYVLGSQYRPSVAPIIEDYEKLTPEEEKKHKKVATQADTVWEVFKRANRKSWTPAEKLRRVVRDGEVFTWIKSREWPPAFRFKDTEEISDGEGEGGNKGIVTDPKDVTEPTFYLVWDEEEGKVVQRIPAEDMTHWKINADSNEKRGRTQYESVITVVRQLMSLVHNEVTHRTAQSAIVLIRKVAGRNKPRQLADNAYTSTTTYPEREMNREKLRAGSIITSSPNIEYEFAQPKGDFSDATPLITLLVSHLSAATGWTIAQITTDASGGNFASSMVNESPVLQMIEYWQSEFADHMDDEYRIVINAALKAGEIEFEGSEEEFWKQYKPESHFPKIANLDPLKHAQTLNLGVVNRSLSRAEYRRQMGVDNERMNHEIRLEDEAAITDMAMQNGLPDAQNMLKSSASNAAGGSGTNQGQKEPIKHRDNRGVTN